MKWIDWYGKERIVNHPLFENATFIRIGKEVDGTNIQKEFDLKNQNSKSVRKGPSEVVRDYYYYVGSEATSFITDSIRKMMIARKGFLIKDKFNDYLILPVCCNNKPTYDDESVGEIKGFDETIILNEDYENDGYDIFGYKEKGYLLYPLPSNYNDLEFIEGKILAKSSIDFSYKTNNIFYYKIKLHDLELVVYENFNAFKQGIFIQNHYIVNDLDYFTYDDSFQNIKIEEKSDFNLYFESECHVVKNQFVNCEIGEMFVEVENVCFDEYAFVNCTCEIINCYSKHVSYFKEIFPNASISIYK